MKLVLPLLMVSVSKRVVVYRTLLPIYKPLTYSTALRDVGDVRTSGCTLYPVRTAKVLHVSGRFIVSYGLTGHLLSRTVGTTIPKHARMSGQGCRRWLHLSSSSVRGLSPGHTTPATRRNVQLIRRMLRACHPVTCARGGGLVS